MVSLKFETSDFLVREPRDRVPLEILARNQSPKPEGAQVLLAIETVSSTIFLYPPADFTLSQACQRVLCLG